MTKLSLSSITTAIFVSLISAFFSVGNTYEQSSFQCGPLGLFNEKLTC